MRCAPTGARDLRGADLEGTRYRQAASAIGVTTSQIIDEPCIVKKRGVAFA